MVWRNWRWPRDARNPLLVSLLSPRAVELFAQFSSRGSLGECAGTAKFVRFSSSRTALPRQRNAALSESWPPPRRPKPKRTPPYGVQDGRATPSPTPRRAARRDPHRHGRRGVRLELRHVRHDGVRPGAPFFPVAPARPTHHPQILPVGARLFPQKLVCRNPGGLGRKCPHPSAPTGPPESRSPPPRTRPGGWKAAPRARAWR